MGLQGISTLRGFEVLQLDGNGFATLSLAVCRVQQAKGYTSNPFSEIATDQNDAFNGH